MEDIHPPEIAVEWTALQSKPELLDAREYPEDLPGFLEQLLTQESILFNGNREKTYESLQNQFPGEPGRVLFAVFLSYAHLREEEKVWEKNSDLSPWERELKRESFQKNHFSKALKEKIFPWSPVRAQRNLVWFLEDYVAKNPYSLSKERWRAVQQTRNELLGDRVRESLPSETDSWRFGILKLVYAREIEQMSETEKQAYFAKLRERTQDMDFWN